VDDEQDRILRLLADVDEAVSTAQSVDGERVAS
jgi:hypothetical protein